MGIGILQIIVDLLPGAVFAIIIAQTFIACKNLMCFLMIKLKDEFHKRIKGRWFITRYVRNSDGMFVLCSESFEIKVSLRYRYQYHAVWTDKENFRYTGHGLYEEGKNITFLLKPHNRRYFEYSYYKFSTLPIENYKTFIGTFVSCDYNHRVCAGIAILSKEHNDTKNEEKLRELTEKYFEICKSTGAISVK